MSSDPEELKKTKLYTFGVGDSERIVKGKSYHDAYLHLRMSRRQAYRVAMYLLHGIEPALSTVRVFDDDGDIAIDLVGQLTERTK